MVKKNYTKINKLFNLLLIAFVLIFINGILNLGGILLFFFTLIFLSIGIRLLYKLLKSKIKGNLKLYLLLTGIGSIIYSFSIFYGTIGIWGLYYINNFIFLSSSIASFGVFSIGVIGTLIILYRIKENER